MVMEQKSGKCPITGSEVSFEIQYNDNDGDIEYIDCSCSEMICCAEFDEERCPGVWADFFNSVFGTAIQPEAAPGADSEPVSEDISQVKQDYAQGTDTNTPPAEEQPQQPSEN